MTVTHQIGVVVPTLGQRTDWLRGAVESVCKEDSYVIAVAPRGSCVDHDLVDQTIWRDKPNNDLAASINAGIAAMPASVTLVTWLNDDDLLISGALEFGRETLNNLPKSPFVYGCCTYVDTNLNHLWHNRFGRIAKILLANGPDLIPQPGVLVRRSAWDQVNGLNESLHLAFDLDLFLRLRKLGNPVFDRRIESWVRWHTNAKSNRERALQVREAEHVRLTNGSGISKIMTRIFAPIIRRVVLVAPLVLLRSR